MVSYVVFTLFVVGSAGVAPNVPTRDIAPGVTMPMLAIGTAPASKKGECSAQEAVELWLRQGGRHIDTAHDYHTQKDVGAAIKASGVPRKELFITTKIPGPVGKKRAIDLVNKTALKELGVAYIDLVLIHFPCVGGTSFPSGCDSKYKQQRKDTWDGLVELQKEGISRAIGVSNWNLIQFAEFQDYDQLPAVNQVQWHLGYHDDELLRTMQASNVTMMAWGSLDGKTPTEHHTPGVPLSDPRLKNISAMYNITTAQLALRWEVQKGVAPVTFTCNDAHAAGDLSSFGNSLTEDDMAFLDSLTPSKSESEMRVV